MTTQQKLIKSKLNLLELGSYLGNVSEACRTHLRSVSAVQPILDATDWIAAHCEICLSVWSKTSRTDRSRTSGEYLCGLPMEPILPNNRLSGKPGGIQKATRYLVCCRDHSCGGHCYRRDCSKHEHS